MVFGASCQPRSLRIMWSKPTTQRNPRSPSPTLVLCSTVMVKVSTGQRSNVMMKVNKGEKLNVKCHNEVCAGYLG